MISHTFSILLLFQYIVGVVDGERVPNEGPEESDFVSVGSEAPGYSITVMGACLIAVAHFVYWISRLIKANSLSDNKAYLPDDGITQRGFRRSWFGSLIKYSVFILQLWLLIAMIMVIIGKYLGSWPFDFSIPTGRVNANSYIRAFVASWMGSVILAIVMRAFSRRIDSFYFRPCSLASATLVKFSCVVSDHNETDQQLAAKYSRVLHVASEPCRFVEFLNKRYTWSNSTGMFVPGSFFPKEGLTPFHIAKSEAGLSTTQVLDNVRCFGKNRDDIEPPSFMEFLKREITSPFYIYQVSVCFVCMFWNYITYAIVVLLLISFSAIWRANAHRRSTAYQRNMFPDRAYTWVKRDAKWTKVLHEEVCVGDVVCFTVDSSETSPYVMADMVVIQGSAVVDETGLSGETFPVRKRNISRDFNLYHSTSVAHRDSSLFAGTRVIHSDGADSSLLPGNTQSGCLALVVNVSGDTMQTQITRKLVIRKRLDTPWKLELLAGVICLTVVGFVEFIWVHQTFGVSLDAVFPAITCIIGLLNPLLILAIVATEVKSIERLESAGIYAQSSDRIALAGKINLALIDKTGTITKQGLELVGLVSAESPNMVDTRVLNIPWPNELSMCVGMAHSVVVSNGKFAGDDMEIQMVEKAAAHGWKYDELHAPTDILGNKWEVLHTFAFNHENMCMSVVVRKKESGDMMLVCKGSFEAIESRCVRLPEDAKQSVRLYGLEGFYVLATATKEIDSSFSIQDFRNRRDVIERELNFAGLLLFSNEMKPDSPSCIREIQSGGIECILITGDGLPTGCSVARSAGIVPDNTRIITGLVDRKTGLPEWRLYETDTVLSEAALLDEEDATICVTGDMYEFLVTSGKLDLTRTKVFARMSPSQKGELVRIYASFGKVVAMCGDSGNDTFALQAAHIGLGLGQSTALTSASSFTSETESLAGLMCLIREGRASLSNVLSSYRFIITIGIAQTVMKIILLTQFSGYPTAASNLIIDCVIIPLLLVSMATCAPSMKLFRTPPEGSLMGPEMILGCSWSLVIFLTTYWICSAVITSEAWYVPFTTTASVSDWYERTDSYDVGLSIIFRLWICVDTAFAYSYGSEYRRTIIFNWKLVLVTSLIMVGILFVLSTNGNSWNCALGVNCSADSNKEASTALINRILFDYEKVGGDWFGVIGALFLPNEFKLVLLSLLLLMSIIHHVGFKLVIQGRAMAWIHEHMGWTDMLSCCACFRRGNPRGYKRLGEIKLKDTSLDDSMMSASEDNSPTVEWHMRRTQGTWRVPEQLKYG